MNTSLWYTQSTRIQPWLPTHRNVHLAYNHVCYPHSIQLYKHSSIRDNSNGNLWLKSVCVVNNNCSTKPNKITRNISLRLFHAMHQELKYQFLIPCKGVGRGHLCTGLQVRPSFFCFPLRIWACGPFFRFDALRIFHTVSEVSLETSI